MVNQAISTAVCQCDKGSALSLLLTYTTPSVKIFGQTVAVISDVHFYAPFGTCMVTQECCQFAPAGEWADLAPTVRFGDTPALLKGSVLPCAKGGLVHLVDVIQMTVGVGVKGAIQDEKGSLLDGLSGPIVGALGVVAEALPIAAGAAATPLAATVAAATAGALGAFLVFPDTAGEGSDKTGNVVNAKKSKQSEKKKANDIPNRARETDAYREAIEAKKRGQTVDGKSVARDISKELEAEGEAPLSQAELGKVQKEINRKDRK